MSNNKLPFSELTAISPLDGRYRSRVEELAPFVSEYALIKYRMEIEIKYLLALSDAGVTRKFTEEEKNTLESYLETDGITFEDIQKVKQTENETRHDVKAMERTFRSMLSGTTLEDQIEMIHIGLTSEDINNIAYRLTLVRGITVLLESLDQIINDLVKLAKENRDVPMLARTHGQPAVPTTIGKEIVIVAVRINRQVAKLKKQKLTGKLNGAVGNFNALQYVYPDIDWISFSEKFIASFDLTPNLITTQINQYDDVVEFLQIISRINGILLDFDQDIWRYISDEWFMQIAKKGEVGSSTMPQKVNPIDFENSEGNLVVANGLIESMSRKLLISRLQRDLSDSTTIRNYGTVLGYSLIGYKSVLTGLSRIQPSKEKIQHSLNKDWSILSEGLQTLLRKNNYPDPYSFIASLLRGKHIDRESWQSLINDSELSESVKKQLSDLSPERYIGLSPILTDKAIKEIEDSSQ
ncbi:MAG TPA: adenylosuccinate lyase [Candidatus Limnocylindrales bacterium]|nr:adenylosuccinate lyase [Candidatus Limnocylindrales bacterium]